MDKHNLLGSRPLVGGQEYSEVKNEDFEERKRVSEDSITQRPPSTELLAYKSHRSAWNSAVKVMISREILSTHLIWLLILAATILVLGHFTPKVKCGVSRLPSDIVFGDSRHSHLNKA